MSRFFFFFLFPHPPPPSPPNSFFNLDCRSCWTLVTDFTGAVEAQWGWCNEKWALLNKWTLLSLLRTWNRTGRSRYSSCQGWRKCETLWLSLSVLLTLAFALISTNRCPITLHLYPYLPEVPSTSARSLCFKAGVTFQDSRTVVSDSI